MTDQKVIELYQQFHLPPHIQRHCLLVAQVCSLIAKNINHHHPNLVNEDNLHYAALLHDLARICDIKNFDPETLKSQFQATDKDISAWQKLRQQHKNTPHWQIACNHLTQIGEPEIAKIILTHDFLAILDPEAQNRTIEQKILYYADKRVCHDKITTLDHRIQEGSQRYIGTSEIPPKVQQAYKLCQKLEAELCDLAQIQAADIK